MSHFTRVQTAIRDQALLRDALEVLGFDVEVGDQVRIHGYQGNTETGQVVVSTGSPFDIGFQRRPDGTYQLCADWWGVQTDAQISQEDFVRDLNRTYAHLTVKKQVLEQGLVIEEERVLENGEIELLVSERF
jgi:hypothetical protein